MHALPVRLEHARAGTEALYKLLQIAAPPSSQSMRLGHSIIYPVRPCSKGVRSRPQLAPLLPFARQFYGSESSYVWTDDAGAEHEVLQAEG